MPDFWWPSPSAFDDLSVEFEDLEDGGAIIHLGAPDGTECADWLRYYTRNEEVHQLFEKELLHALLSHAQRLIDGENQIQSDEQDQDRPRGQEDLARSFQDD